MRSLIRLLMKPKTEDAILAQNVRDAAKAYNEAVSAATTAGIDVVAYVRSASWTSCHPEYIGNRLIVLKELSIFRQHSPDTL